jgi:hypothetical protein
MLELEVGSEGVMAWAGARTPADSAHLITLAW